MTRKTASPRRLKHDGSADTMCLSCFMTFPSALAQASSQNKIEEHDHTCAFPERRANQVALDDGPKHGHSDTEWQAPIARESMLSAG